MWLTDALAAIVIMMIVTTGFVLTVSATAWLTVRVVQRSFEYLERVLELRRFEVESRLEETRTRRALPPWVDVEDPIEVAAWNQAVAETWRVGVHRDRQIGTA